MTHKPTTEDDQLARFRREVSDGSWLANARNRSQRRKSPWNLLLALVGLPLLIAFTTLLVWLASIIHAAVYPGLGHKFFGPGTLGIGQVLVLVCSFVAAVAPALFVTNFLVYLVPPARRAMDTEDRDFPSVAYGPSQRALLKLGLWLLAACLPLVLIGALLR
jgi:hypothetical protein